MRERVRRVSCTSIQRTPHPPATHTSAVASIRTHTYRAVTSISHTCDRGVQRGAQVKLKRGYPAVLPSFPVLRNNGPTTNRIASPGRCLWCRPTWQLFVLLTRRRTQCEGRSTSYISRRYSRFHLLFLARFIVAVPRLLSPASRQKFHDAVTHVIRTGQTHLQHCFQ